MPRHDVPRRAEIRRPPRDPDYERWRDEYMRRLDKADEDSRRVRPDAGPTDADEQPQSPGAEPLHKKQEQQH
jgi:hypothetical protein